MNLSPNEILDDNLRFRVEVVGGGNLVVEENQKLLDIVHRYGLNIYELRAISVGMTIQRAHARITRTE
jgi:hypothetical protein